jgi:hypothetical protein
MIDEEMQKTVQFILEQQAKTAVSLDVLAETVEALAVSQERSEKKWERTEEGIRMLLSIAEIHEREIATLSENGEATDERLNALISVVEKDIGERRNGKS